VKILLRQVLLRAGRFLPGLDGDLRSTPLFAFSLTLLFDFALRRQPDL